MNFERAKSIILIILIVTSSYLTWSIWTYEPKYEKIDQSKYINIESDEQTVSDIIKPNHILIHRYNQHFQTSNQADIEKAEKQMAEWKLSNLKRHSPQLTKKQFEDVVHAQGTVEIIFPNEIPLTLYKTAFYIKDKEVPPFSFDRIIYKQKDIQSQKAIIYFASSESLNFLEATVETSKLKNFNLTFYQNASAFPEYESFLVNKYHQVFVPKHQVTLNRYKYYMGYLDIGNFKDALFTDPMNVRHETVPKGEEYTDSTRLMTVNNDTNMISYINPSQKSTVLSNSSDLLSKSIEFINNHAGWKGSNYQFDSMNETMQSVSFRLYNNSYPVFNSLGMSEIKEIWGDEQIYSYQRPYFTLDFELPSETQEVLMPSGPDVMKQLKMKRNFDYANVEDVRIGYKLSTAPLETNLISLEPTWYYRSGEDWLTVPFDESGGKINGLE